LTVQQFTLDFEPGICERFPRWRDTFLHAVYSGRGGLNSAAAACDVSPTDLTKRLSGEYDDRPLRIEDIEAILTEKKDPTPIFWLIERFLRDPSARQQEALARLAGLVPMIEATLAQAGGGKKAARR
jgi:hypothetical protein